MNRDVRERMGPGGLRGLQIRSSGASGVRGGFDSHAFPPFFRRLGCAVVLTAFVAAVAAASEGASAAGSAPDSLAAPADTAVARGRSGAGDVSPARSRADTSAAPAAIAPRARAFSAPGWIMARSAIVPGWGQLTNGAWTKAIAVAGAQAWLASRVVGDFREMDRLSARIDEAAARGDEAAHDALVLDYNARLDQSIRREWLMAGVFAYSLLDAYVDAHFRNFELQFTPPPAPPSDAQPLSAAISLRWSF